MKVLVILSILYAQANASIFDKLRGAVSNVEVGVEKLVTDIVSDVQDSIHSTLSAVEQVLILKGLLDKPDSKYRLPKYNLPSYDIGRSHRNLFETSKNHKRPKKSSIRTELESESRILEEDTHRLKEISDMLKRELGNLSTHVRSKMKRLQQEVDSVESIWARIKDLQDLQQKSNDQSERNEIHKVLNAVVNKLGVPNAHKSTGTFNMDDIKKHLISITRKDLTTQNIDNVTSKYLTNHIETQTAKSIVIPKNFKEAAQNIFKQTNVRAKSGEDALQIFQRDKKTTHTEKSVFDMGFDNIDFYTPFSKDPNHKETIDNALKIIKDSQHTDKVLNNFFQTQKSEIDIFSSADLFNFGKQ